MVSRGKAINFYKMGHFVFRCPATGFNVQHQLDDDTDISENEYEARSVPPALGYISSIEKPASRRPVDNCA
jgi:hypothetical protein